jgi:hypothetical protein
MQPAQQRERAASFAIALEDPSSGGVVRETAAELRIQR